jgi:hypothetical protein
LLDKLQNVVSVVLDKKSLDEMLLDKTSLDETLLDETSLEETLLDEMSLDKMASYRYSRLERFS